jgi:hypothetical protein
MDIDGAPSEIREAFECFVATTPHLGAVALQTRP